MCMTAMVACRHGALVATDTRHFDHGTPDAPIEPPAVRDLGHKLLRAPGFWFTGTGSGNMLRSAQTELIQCDDVDAIPDILARHWAGLCTWRRAYNLPALAPRDTTFLITTPGGMIADYDGDGVLRNRLHSGDVHVAGLFNYSLDISVPAMKRRDVLSRAAIAAARSAFDVIRAVAREFAWAAGQGDGMSATVEIGTGEDTFISGPAAVIATASDDAICEMQRTPPAPLSRSVWAADVAARRTA